MPIGRFVRIAGSSVSGNNGAYLVTEVAKDGSYIVFNKTFTAQSAGQTITLTYLNNYVDEIAPNSGSQYSKYFSKQNTMRQFASLILMRRLLLKLLLVFEREG